MKPAYVSSQRVVVFVAIAAGVLPILGVNLAYWLAQTGGHVPSCFPYLEGCTSISATGRQVPEKLLFQATMFPAAALMAIYWYLVRQWLAVHGDVTRSARGLAWMGLAAAVFLLGYTAILGYVGDWYDIPRRMAVVSYLAVSFMAQLIFYRRLEALLRGAVVQPPNWIVRAKLALLAGMLLAGLASVPAWLLTENSKTVERILQWNFCLLLASFYPLTGWMWRGTGFCVSFTEQD